MTDTSRFLARAPAGLTEALERRRAEVVFSWSENLRAFAHAASPEGDLFARYSGDPADVARLEHEAGIRTLVGDSGALRAPPVFERGSGWMVERAVNATPWRGSEAVDAAARAAAEIPTLDLPPPMPGERRSRLSRLVQIARAAGGPVGAGNLRAARRELAQTDLPWVTCHRDFHPKNVLIEGDQAWVIDWERSRRGPVGLDLMQLWASLADPGDRERTFEHAVELVGARRRASLERLRFAVVVAETSGMLAAHDPFDRDDAAVARMLKLIPTLRPKR